MLHVVLPAIAPQRFATPLHAVISDMDMPKGLKYSVNVHQTCSKDDATKIQ